jgi:hypothetical protein
LILNRNLFFILFSFFVFFANAQSDLAINARLIPEEKLIDIQQQIKFKNTSQSEWTEVYLTDWAHSFSSKQTPLAKRFDENYEKKFHLAKEEDRGRTDIKSISTKSTFLQFRRLEDHPDIIRVVLRKPIKPGESYDFTLLYRVTLPDAKFTRYGVTRVNDYNLRFWFLTPTPFLQGKWQYYSNKNLDDRYFPKSDLSINFSIPSGYDVISDLEVEIENSSYKLGDRILKLNGKDRIRTRLLLRQESTYETIETDYFTLVTNIKDKSVPDPIRAIIVDKVAQYLHKALGPYPHKKLLVSDLDYKESPVYGLNQLPEFVRPFPDGFQYEVKLIKTSINNYVNNTILVNPRYDRWALDGIKVYLLHQYLDEYYPDLKVVGNLEKYWLVRQFYASKLEFTDQFNLLYMHMARLNLDQPISKPYDSLIKYNKNIGNSYKTGAGLHYLGEFIGQENLGNSIKEFYNKYALQPCSSSDFEEVIRSKTAKDINWFFDDYLKTRKKIDFKITKAKSVGDSLKVTIKNKRDNAMPVSIFGFKNDSLISKRWVENIDKEKSIYYKKDSIDRFVLNYDKAIPEYNLRDNYKNPKALFGFDKPLQFKFFQDFENPEKSQVFFQPTFEFNIYDGLAPGIKMYNTTILTKGLRYKIEPQYGLRSKKLVGSAAISYTHNIEQGNLFSVRYGIGANTFSYAPNLFFRRVTPFARLSWRTEDLRSDKRQSLSARFVSVNRDENPNQQEQPNYDVLNFRYSNRNPGIVNTINYNTDLQFAKDFGKLSATVFYRHLYLNNRQLNLRFFAGTFLYNNTRETGDFFSFALDRPTDYLFDYNYYARSDDSGIFSQQIIIAEGGFKSQLPNPFANEFIFTTNASTTIWKYIYGYGDVGFIKSLNNNGRFVYDTGIQVSLLDDFFELFFPIYSNLGWEIGQPNYDQRIRFQVEISIDTVIRLFTRKWY